MLVALAATSLLVNAALVAGVVVLFSSASARDWTAATLDLATDDELDPIAELEADLTAVADRTDKALTLAGSGPTEGEIAEVQTAVSELDLRLGAVESALADQASDLDATCDWARLQEANFENTSLFTVFYDYTQSVCLT